MPFRVRFLKCYFMGLGVGAGPYIRDPRLAVMRLLGLRDGNQYRLLYTLEPIKRFTNKTKHTVGHTRTRTATTKFPVWLRI